jgi:hypothetical protein
VQPSDDHSSVVASGGINSASPYLPAPFQIPKITAHALDDGAPCAFVDSLHYQDVGDDGGGAERGARVNYDNAMRAMPLMNAARQGKSGLGICWR